MTDLKTPLPVIAHLLPPTSARKLIELGDIALQTLILCDVRAVIVGWEQSGLDLDPITFSKALEPVVDTLLLSRITLKAVLSRREEG